MSEQNEQLLPCPFCGGKGDKAKTAFSHYMTCIECNADGPFEKTEAEAIAAWNRRAQPAPTVQAEPVLWIDPAADPHQDQGSLYPEDNRQIALLGSTKGPFGSYTTPLYAGAAPAHASSDGRDALRAAAEEFVRRCEAGEIRSKRSYEAFKAALAGTGVKKGGS